MPIAKTGLIITLQGLGNPIGEQKTIAFRADIDALHMKEENDQLNLANDELKEQNDLIKNFLCEKYGEEAILKAVEFELLWLQSKRRFYSGIKKEDEKRIVMLEERLK